MLSSSVSPTPSAGGNLLIVDEELAAGTYASSLRSTYRIATARDFDAARRWLQQSSVDLVVSGSAISGGSGAELCRIAKTLPVPASVLITTHEPTYAPDAILAGCDGVLLKPFAPNLLYARIGRLMRAREQSAVLRERLDAARSKMRHLVERNELRREGTIVTWPNTSCPYCNHAGVTMFDFASTRRAWYACLECRKVWLAKRLE